ncbi:MAG: long-chain fatty acid--CoA ligase [Deltaproteobacteria bacterium]|nr:long-chain fatty acid--CoA ligase [Deltaproteobacteria bacterium]
MTSYAEKPWLKWYDPHVTEEIPVPDISYLEFMEKGLKSDPNRVAFYFLGSSGTFGELDELSDRFARYLVNKGCVKGDVVGINLPNIPQYMIALAGVIKAGCVVSGVSPLLTQREIVHQLNDSKAKVFFTLDALFQARLVGVADQIPDLKHVVVTNVADYLPAVKQFLGKLLKKIPSGKIVPLKGKEVISYKDLIAAFPADKPGVDLSPDDTCLLQYTGGTTGPSKGTVLTHRNVTFDAAQCIQWLYKDIDANSDILDCKRGQDMMCSGFPFFHSAGLVLGLASICLGNPQILVPDPRNTDQICKDMKKYKPTQLVNVPTLYQMMMENPAFRTIDFSSVKYCLSGAAPFDVDSMKKLESFVGKGKVVEMYGMTETSPLISINPVYGKNKIGSVGIPAQNTKIKIVDVADGATEMQVGEPGELIVSGPQVMKGYHGNPEATKDTIREIDGDMYLYTGDVAKMDEDGFLYIVDRTKDMLLVGGFNVYSKQVEETLYESPEVELCAIIGEPNPERPGSEIVKAIIQLREADQGKDETAIREKILSHCKEHMAPYKVPKIVKFVSEIPLTAVGKVDKKALR